MQIIGHQPAAVSHSNVVFSAGNNSFSLKLSFITLISSTAIESSTAMLCGKKSQGQQVLVFCLSLLQLLPTFSWIINMKIVKCSQQSRWSKSYHREREVLPSNQTILLQPLWLEHINLWQNSSVKSKRIESDRSHSYYSKTKITFSCLTSIPNCNWHH